MNLPDVIVTIKANVDGLKKGLGDAKKWLEESTGAAAESSKIFTAGVGGMSAAAIAFGFKSVGAFEESQNVMAQTTAVLKSTAGASGMTAEAVGKLASALQSQSTFGDESIQTGENLLLTFTNIGKDTFPQATQAMVDLATAMHTDVSGGAIQLGKALNDPVKGITALTRVGVTFSDEQQKVIKRLQETGDMAGAQKVILQELDREFGGSASAASQTFQGKLTVLSNIFGDFMELVGKFIVDRIQPFVDGLSGWIDKIGGAEGLFKLLTDAANKWKEWLPELITFIVVGMTPALYAMTAAALGLMASLAEILIPAAAVAFAVKLLIDHFGGWDNTVKLLSKTWTETFAPAIEKAFKWLTDMWNKYGVPTFKFIEAAFIAAVGWFQDNWGTIQKLWTGIWNQIKGTFEVVWGAIQVIQGVMMGIFTGKWDKAWALIKKGFGEIWDGIKNIVSGAWDQISNSFKLFVPVAIEWGKHLIQNFIDGIKSYIGNLANSISGVVKTVKGLLGFSINPNLPSEEWGAHMIENFIGGVKKTMPGLRNSLQGVIGTISGFGAQAASPTGGVSSGIGTTINISMAGANIPSAAAGQEIARQMGEQLVKVLKNQIRI